MKEGFSKSHRPIFRNHLHRLLAGDIFGPGNGVLGMFLFNEGLEQTAYALWKADELLSSCQKM